MDAWTSAEQQQRVDDAELAHDLHHDACRASGRDTQFPMADFEDDAGTLAEERAA